MKKTLTALTLAICAIGSAQAAPTQWGGNGHWYEFIAGNFTWAQARTAANTSNFGGMQGYLVTMTSAAENTFASALATGATGALQLAWIGGTDEGTEGIWKWADGPEAGDTFWTGAAGGFATGFANWWGGEPNDFQTGEDYAHTNWGGAGFWNDHGAPNSPTLAHGYLVEYSIPEPMTLGLVMSALLTGAITRRRRA